MSEMIQGSVEIVHGNESTGVVGSEWVPGEVPIVLRNLYGIRDMEEAEPTAAESGRAPENQWTAKDSSNQDVTVRLWREIPHEETYADEIGADLVEQEE